MLAGVGIVGPDGDVDHAIAAIDRFYLNGLLELGTLQMLADFKVRPTAETGTTDAHPTMLSPRSVTTFPRQATHRSATPRWPPGACYWKPVGCARAVSVSLI